jgi:nucleotide-binding universal stress UspA family protein
MLIESGSDRVEPRMTLTRFDLEAIHAHDTETEMTDTNGDGAVLFAYDGSEQAKASIRAAAQQLNPGRHGIVLTVWQPYEALSLGAPASVDLETSMETEAQRVANEGAALATSVGFEATPLAQRGSPVWRTIVESANDHDAGIVVMGSHGRTGIRLVLMGSVAAAVARHAELPVLIVHPPSDESAGAD